MKLSIVTAVYNRERTIGTAVESLRSQSHGDVEHVVVDGGSTDATLDILDGLAHPSMTVRSEPDDGIYDALNKGMGRATGEVVGILHSDDYYAHPDVLSRVAEVFERSAVDMVYGDLDYVIGDDPDRILRRWRAGGFGPRSLRYGWMPPHPALFLRRRVLDRYGSFNVDYRIAADYEAILRWFGQPSVDVAYLPEVLVKMRAGGASNRSIGQIVRKSREDYRALRTTGTGGILTLSCKNLRKVPQFFVRA